VFFTVGSAALTDNEAQYPITFAEDLPQVVRHARETNFDYLLTGDESWFYYEYQHDFAWAPWRDPLPTRASKKKKSKNA
jgi:hypothetical protein